MEEKNVFSNKKILLIVFLVLSFIFVIVSSISYRGLIFDQPAIFFSLISGEDSPGFNYLFHDAPRVRMFSMVLFSLPFNLVVHDLPNNLVIKNNFFCFSYSIMTFLFLCFNLWLTTRTKRYDVAVWAVVFYALFYYPNSVWFAREIHISVLMQFALLQYFLSDHEFKTIDWVLFTILGLGVWESSENVILPASLMFIYSIVTLFFNQKKASMKKLILGGSSLLCCFYVVLRISILSSTGTSEITFVDAFIQYWKDILASLPHFLHSCLLITTASIVMLIYLSLRKKTFTKEDAPFAILLTGILAYSLWKKTGFIPCANMELLLYVIPVVAMFFATLFILVCDYINYDYNNKPFYTNLLMVALVFGCFHCLFQLNACRYSYQYAMEFLEKINNDEKITEIESRDNLSEAFMAYDTCFGTLHRTMILAPDKAQEKLVLPYKDPNNIEAYEHCMTPTFYDKAHKHVEMQTVQIYKNNRYFDMNKMKQLLEDANIEYKYKN